MLGSRPSSRPDASATYRGASGRCRAPCSRHSEFPVKSCITLRPIGPRLGLEKCLMHEVRMIAIDAVFHLELPVAIVAILMSSGARLDRALRRQIHEQIDVVFGACEIVRELLHFGAKTREHQPAIVLDSRRLDESELALVEIASVAIGIGHANQLALIVVGPAVIPASKRAGVAALILAYGRAAMHASIHQDVDVAVLVARHDGGLSPNRHGLDSRPARLSRSRGRRTPSCARRCAPSRARRFPAQGRSCDELGCPEPTLQASTVMT